MHILKFVTTIFFIFLLLSCTKDIKKENIIKEKSLDLQVLEAYEAGLKSLNAGDVIFAAKKFNEVEILFPQSKWAPKSALMAAYSYYIQDYYNEAIAELERFIRIYSYHKDLDYAYYLLALSYYEQIADEKKDLENIKNAEINFNYIIEKYPSTEYALDAQFKLDLVLDLLAAKEIYLGRYYFKKRKWIPAINRFKIIVDKYDTTIYIEEALHRLVEIYYKLGIKQESEKYAQLLGYNYGTSEWYQKTYSIFDNKYEINKKNKYEEKKGINKKIKSLLKLND